MVTLNIAKEFTDAPGARTYDDGDKSGQEFYDYHLLPKFQEAVKKNTVLEINLEDSYGYPPSFIDGSFCELARNFGLTLCVRHITFVPSTPDPLPEYILKEMLLASVS